MRIFFPLLILCFLFSCSPDNSRTAGPRSAGVEKATNRINTEYLKKYPGRYYYRSETVVRATNGAFIYTSYSKGPLIRYNFNQNWCSVVYTPPDVRLWAGVFGVSPDYIVYAPVGTRRLVAMKLSSGVYEKIRTDIENIESILIEKKQVTVGGLIDFTNRVERKYRISLP